MRAALLRFNPQSATRSAGNGCPGNPLGLSPLLAVSVRRATHGVALSAFLILIFVFGTPVWAAEIPPLRTPSEAAAARYPELAKIRASLLQKRNELRDRTRLHNQECRAIEEGSPDESRCRSAQAKLNDALRGHVEKSSDYNDQVKRAESCVARRVVRDRLVAGMPVQRDAIHRADAQLQAARSGGAAASAEARAALVKGAVEQAKAYAQMTLTQADALRGQIQALSNLDPGTRDQIIHILHTLNMLNFGAEKLLASLKAGAELGRETQTQADSLTRGWLEVYDFLVSSRLLEQAGIQLSTALGGPYGGMAFRGCLTLIEVAVALGDGQMSQADQEAAEYTLGTLRTQYDRTTRRIATLEEELAAQCR